MIRRMEMKHLYWRKRKLADGTVQRYPAHVVTWMENGKRRTRQINLDWQGDERRLFELYWMAESGQLSVQQKKAKYTWGEIVKLWREDPRRQSSLAEKTKASYKREMDYLLERNATKSMQGLTRADLRAVHSALADTPRKADWRIQIVSILWNYAVRHQDWPLGVNPASGFDLYGISNPWKPWPAWMVDAAEDAPEDVRTIVHLILGRGERPGAAVMTRWDGFNGDWMTVTDEKGSHTYEVYCPAELREFLDNTPKRGAYLLAKNLNEPLGYSAVEKKFAAWRKTLGPKAKPFVLHGLRKLAIVRLAESGATDAEIQAITNQTVETIVYYRQMADRKVMSRNAQLRKEKR